VSEVDAHSKAVAEMDAKVEALALAEGMEEAEAGGRSITIEGGSGGNESRWVMVKAGADAVADLDEARLRPQTRRRGKTLGSLRKESGGEDEIESDTSGDSGGEDGLRTEIWGRGKTLAAVKGL